MSSILFLAHRLPFLPDRGDEIRSHHVLKALARLAPVHVGCFGETPLGAPQASKHFPKGGEKVRSARTLIKVQFRAVEGRLCGTKACNNLVCIAEL